MGTGALGVAHVGITASDLERSLAFYRDVPGFELLLGDRGRGAGTILTFFPWPAAPRGRAGTGQFAAVGLAVPEAALGSWLERSVANGVPHETPARRFGERVVACKDPDGLALELVATPAVAGRAVHTSPRSSRPTWAASGRRSW
jgi:catechol 2,3-dioxygenase-like lactoylglutathione lyase family enzyme